MKPNLARVVAQARNERASMPSLSLATPIVLSVSAVFAYMALAVAAGPPGDPGHQFGEGLAINALSAALLAATAAFAFSAMLIRSHSDARGRWFWLVMGGGFAFLCLDEQLELHERLGGALDRALGVPSLLRGWDDAVVLAYGLVGAVVMVVCLREILRVPGFAELLAVGVVLYGLHTGIDGIFAAGSLKDIFEEGAKILANTFFALAAMSATLTLDRAEPRAGVAYERTLAES